MNWSAPNIITLLRIALIPLFALVFYLPFTWAGPASAVIFALAGISDWLDGWLARRLDQMSAFGAFLDPVADKLIVAVALVMLVDRHGSLLLVVPASVIIGREIAVSALREWMAELGRRNSVAVTYIAKVKTALQMIALLLLLYYQPIGDFATYWAGIALIYAAASLTLWSMVLYLRTVWRMMAEAPDAQ